LHHPVGQPRAGAEVDVHRLGQGHGRHDQAEDGGDQRDQRRRRISAQVGRWKMLARARITRRAPAV
jgi:hypothetical protein